MKNAPEPAVPNFAEKYLKYRQAEGGHGIFAA
jgi:hypothetical protein